MYPANPETQSTHQNTSSPGKTWLCRLSHCQINHLLGMGFFWAEVRAKKRRRVSKGSCREWQECSCSRRDTHVPKKITSDAQGPLPSMCADVTPASMIVSELLLLPFLSLLQYFSSVAQSCPTLLNPMYCSTPGLPVHYQLLEFA